MKIKANLNTSYIPCQVRLERRGLLILCFMLLLGLWGQNAVLSAAPPEEQDVLYTIQESYLNCRFGVGVTSSALTTYNITSLNLGWYLNWRALLAPDRPGEIEFAQVLRVSGSTYSPSGDDLADIIANNPGALWLVGNEPDCIYQDNVLPQDYAQAYHDAYFFIKAHDPTAQVAVGSIVQPTPLRIQYLEQVLTHYLAQYQVPLPTDAWSIHSFILREASCSAYPDACWGAEIPPGVTATAGEWYELEDTDDLDIFQERIIQFRRWMRDWGYRDTPLLITEYGTLVPHTYAGWSKERAAEFMTGTFEFLLNVSDPAIGYPADEDRLVQRWLWYSLDDTRYGGYLFNPHTGAPEMAPYFSAFTSAIAPTVDLVAVQVTQQQVPLSLGEPVTLTLLAKISNVGNIAVTQPIQVDFFDAEDTLIGTAFLATPLQGCAEVGTVSIVWPNVLPGAHQIRIVVDPQNEISELTTTNNESTTTVLVATHRLYLPLITRKR